METEAETGGTRPPAQGRLEPPELEEAGRRLPGACGGSGPGDTWTSDHLDLRRPVSSTGEGDCRYLPPSSVLHGPLSRPP